MITCQRSDSVQVALCTGVVTAQELADFCDEWARDPNGSSMLIDLQRADDLKANAAVMSDLSQGCSDHEPSRRVALVAVRDLLFGMCRMMEMMHPGPSGQIRCFRERAAAEAWLGMRPVGDETDRHHAVTGPRSGSGAI
jgi:hypothetical protein